MNLDLLETILKTKSAAGDSPVKAILPVHLYGRILNMDKVMELAKEYKVFVIEDCAQAHRAEFKGKIAGTWGHAGSFSFYPGKNLGAYGDGGAVITDDPQLAEKIRKLANHGRIGKYDHEFEGFNSRLDGLQAAFLRVKLPHLAKWTQKRQELAMRYTKLLKNVPDIELFDTPENGLEHVYHLFVIKLQHRDAVQAYLKEKNIETGVHYPTSLPFLKAYAYLGHSKSDFPESFKLQTKILSLPLFPELTIEEQDYIVQSLIDAVKIS